MPTLREKPEEPDTGQEDPANGKSGVSRRQLMTMALDVLQDYPF